MTGISKIALIVRVIFSAGSEFSVRKRADKTRNDGGCACRPADDPALLKTGVEGMFVVSDPSPEHLDRSHGRRGLLGVVVIGGACAAQMYQKTSHYRPRLIWRSWDVCIQYSVCVCVCYSNAYTEV